MKVIIILLVITNSVVFVILKLDQGFIQDWEACTFFHLFQLFDKPDQISDANNAKFTLYIK